MKHTELSTVKIYSYNFLRFLESSNKKMEMPKTGKPTNGQLAPEMIGNSQSPASPQSQCFSNPSETELRLLQATALKIHDDCIGHPLPAAGKATLPIETSAGVSNVRNPRCNPVFTHTHLFPSYYCLISAF